MDLDGPLRSVWDRGHITVGELWSYYCRYPYLSRLKDRAVLDDAVLSVLARSACRVEGFALAEALMRRRMSSLALSSRIRIVFHE